MKVKLENKLEELKNKKDITYEELHSVFFILKDMLDIDKKAFNESFDNFVSFLKETNYNKLIYADFLFISFYYKNCLDKYDEYKDFFIKKFNFKEDEFLDLSKYENYSTVYCYHDGMPIVQVLKINDDKFDILYDMGKNEKKKRYYYKSTLNKELLDQFNKNKLSLKDILLLGDTNTQKCIESDSGNHYTLHQKDIKEIEEEISDELYVSLFSNIWGDAEEWEGIVLY